MTASARRASGEIPQKIALPPAGRLPGRLAPSEMFPAGVAGVTTRFITPPSGTRTRVVECGPADGRVVLMLHGWGGSVYTFRHTLQSLGHAGYRAIAIDLKGSGLTDKPEHDDAYTLSSMVDHVEEVVTMLGLSRMAVLGHSMGGAIAMALNSRLPAAITHLGLLASARMGRVPTMRILRALAARPIAQVTPYLCGRAIIAGILRFAHGRPRRFTDRDVDEYWAPTQYPAKLHAAFALIRRFDWSLPASEELASLEMPCLVMTGARDRVISTAGVASRVANIPDARYRNLADHGHLFVESSYDITNEEILTLLSRRAPAGQ